RALPHAHVVVLGGTPASAPRDVRADLHTRLSAGGLDDRVHLPGYVDNALSWIAGFDVAVVPSVYADPCPLAVLEALAVGVPVVASRVGGIPGLVDDGRDGVLTQAGDARALAGAVIELAEQSGRRGVMAAHARESARRRFDVQRMAAAVAL